RCHNLAGATSDASREAALLEVPRRAHGSACGNAYHAGNGTFRHPVFRQQEVCQRRRPMSDFRSDPNFPRSEMREYDSRVQWAAVAVILLLVGGLIIAAAWNGGEMQTA